VPGEKLLQKWGISPCKKQKKNLDYSLLIEYAKKLNVEKILNTYMEVLI